MTTALRDGATRRLAALYALNTSLEWIGSIALMVVAYELTDNALAAAALLLCKQVVPALMVPSFASRIEHVEARAALAITAGTQAAALLALALVGYSPVLGPVLLLLVVASGVANALHRSAIRATLARAADPAALRGANALLNVTMGIVVPAAPVVAAAVIASAGAQFTLLVTAAAFAAIAIGCISMSPFPVFETQLEGTDDEIKASAPYATAKSAPAPISWLVALAALTTAVSAIDEPSLLAFSRDALESGVSGYGAIFAAQAVGATFGSLLFGRLLAWPMLRVYALATTIAGIGFLGMAASPTIEFVCAAGFLVGFGAGMDWVAIVTAAQEAAPRGRETQVVARVEAAAMMGPALGLTLGGLIAEIGSPRLALVAPGALSILIVAVGFVALRLRSSRLRLREPIVLSPSISGGSV